MTDGLRDGLEALIVKKQEIDEQIAELRVAKTEILDERLNNGVPDLASSLYHRAKKLQTGVLSYNIAYMAFILVFLILVLMSLGGMN